MEQLTHYWINYSSVEVTLSLYMNYVHIPSSVGFSAPKLHTSALTAILYMFVAQTTPTINKLAIGTNADSRGTSCDMNFKLPAFIELAGSSAQLAMYVPYIA